MEIKKFKLNDGTYFRYKKIGKGKPILLLHTFRNRLEYSDKLGELLKSKNTVYSIDLPGFGDSPINSKTIYDLNFFTNSIIEFIKNLKINNLKNCRRIYWCSFICKRFCKTSKTSKKNFYV